MLKYFIFFMGLSRILGDTALSTEPLDYVLEDGKAQRFQNTFFSNLPEEIVNKIFSGLSQKDLLNLRLTSKNFDRLIGKILEARPLTFEECKRYKDHPFFRKYLKTKVFKDRDYEFLSQSSFTAINLDNVKITLLQLNTLGKSPKLVYLNLKGNALPAEGAKVLSQEGLFPALKTLFLGVNNLGNEGALFLSQGSFPCLKKLDLGHNKIEDEGAISLSKGKFPVLQVLLLPANGIKNEGAIALLQSSLPALNVLNLWVNKILDPVTETSLQKKLPTEVEREVLERLIGSEGVRGNLKVYL